MSDYKNIRKRIEGYKGKYITDKDIIEEQEKEIEYYRDKIKTLEENIHNKRTFERKFDIDINNEKYLIMYNINADQVMLYASLIKLINEKDKYVIVKDNDFKIINETRFKSNRFTQW